MRVVGRVRPFCTTNIIWCFVYFCAYIILTDSAEHGIPIEIKLWDTGRTPLAHMVDVTNEFGLKVLAEHNFLNDNNIAFSPYGLMGIMVALYEGVDGESSYQIQRGMQLPWNRNVMRIGFRDIHRTLKTYFVPEEGFLAGLALNNENVTFNEQYKKILRFYGFDLENDQLPTLSPETNNTSNVTSATTSTMSSTSSGDSSTTAMTSENTNTNESSSISNKEETTTTINPNAETISAVDIRGDTSTVTSQSFAPNAESASTTVTITETTTGTQGSTITIPEASTSESSTETVPMTATSAQTTIMQTEITSTLQTASSTAQIPITSTQITTTEGLDQTTTIPPNTAIATETIAQTTTNIPEQTSTVTALSTALDTETTALTSDALTNQLTTGNEMSTSPNLSVSTFQSTTDIASSTTVQTSADTTPSTTLSSTDSAAMTFTTMPLTDGVTTSADTQQTDQMSTTAVTDMTTTNFVATMANEPMIESFERRKRSIVDFIFTNPPYLDGDLYYRSYDVGSEVVKPTFDDEMFLANGLKSVQVTYMHYDTILEYAYLPHLEAAALRLPLDSDRYYLLVVLPKREGPSELGRLMSRMARESDLSDIYSVLRPRRVKGIVPSFIVKGHVTLTTDLQKLGIRDVFEPRQRDFTPMTKQLGVYVRSIEQAVSVAIRKYRPDDQKKHRYVTNRDPVVFSATYPFLYFVMDSNIHVALMAGKMADPLNTRIL